MERNSIRLRNFDYATSGAYFVTICSYQRERFFGSILENTVKNSRVGDLIEECWYEIPNHFTFAQLDEFVIMPNHIHAIIWLHRHTPTVGARHASPLADDVLKQTRKELALSKSQHNPNPALPSPTLGTIVGAFKSAVTKQARQHLQNPDIKIWQCNYFDRIIRNDHELENIREYIIHNPINWQFDLEAKTGLQLHEMAFLEVTA